MVPDLFNIFMKGITSLAHPEKSVGYNIYFKRIPPFAI
jgi:hypothetical protein